MGRWYSSSAAAGAAAIPARTSSTAAQWMELFTWPAGSMSAARSGQGWPSCADGGPGCDRRADTCRPAVEGPYRRWKAGPNGQGRLSARVMATQTALACTRSPDGPDRVVVRSAHPGPDAEQNVLTATCWQT